MLSTVKEFVLSLGRVGGWCEGEPPDVSLCDLWRWILVGLWKGEDEDGWLVLDPAAFVWVPGKAGPLPKWWVGEAVQDRLVYGWSDTLRCISLLESLVLDPTGDTGRSISLPITGGCIGVDGVGHRLSHDPAPVRHEKGIR